MEPPPRPHPRVPLGSHYSLAVDSLFHLCLEAALFTSPHMQSEVWLGGNILRFITPLLDSTLYSIHPAGVGSLQSSLNATMIP